MVGHIRALTDEVAAEMKERIWEGATAPEVSKTYGISTLTVSRIRSGLAYEDVAWPDGSTGELAPYRVQALSKMRRRGTVTDKLYDAGVEKLYADDDHPLSAELAYEMGCEGYHITPGPGANYVLDSVAKRKGFRDWPTYMQRRADIRAKAEAEQDRLNEIAENKKLMQRIDKREADPDWIADSLAKRKADAAEHPMQRHDIIDPTDKEKRDWEEILELAPDHPLVMVVESSPESQQSLKDALRIAFYDPQEDAGVPKDKRTPIIKVDRWADKNTSAYVLDIMEKINNWKKENMAL